MRAVLAKRLRRISLGDLEGLPSKQSRKVHDGGGVTVRSERRAAVRGLRRVRRGLSPAEWREEMRLLSVPKKRKKLPETKSGARLYPDGRISIR